MLLKWSLFTKIRKTTFCTNTLLWSDCFLVVLEKLHFQAAKTPLSNKWMCCVDTSLVNMDSIAKRKCVHTQTRHRSEVCWYAFEIWRFLSSRCMKTLLSDVSFSKHNECLTQTCTHKNTRLHTHRKHRNIPPHLLLNSLSSESAKPNTVLPLTHFHRYECVQKKLEPIRSQGARASDGTGKAGMMSVYVLQTINQTLWFQLMPFLFLFSCD